MLLNIRVDKIVTILRNMGQHGMAEGFVALNHFESIKKRLPVPVSLQFFWKVIIVEPFMIAICP